jgi:hypothetical protein
MLHMLDAYIYGSSILGYVHVYTCVRMRTYHATVLFIGYDSPAVAVAALQGEQDGGARDMSS